MRSGANHLQQAPYRRNWSKDRNIIASDALRSFVPHVYNIENTIVDSHECPSKVSEPHLSGDFLGFFYICPGYLGYLQICLRLCIKAMIRMPLLIILVRPHPPSLTQMLHDPPAKSRVCCPRSGSLILQTS